MDSRTMKTVSLKLDWLTVTFPYQGKLALPQTENEVALLMHKLGDMVGDYDAVLPKHGQLGYAYVGTTCTGITIMAGNNQAQGMALVFTAQAIQRFGGTADVCKWYADLAPEYGFRTTRYDVALDVKGDSTPEVTWFAAAYEQYLEAKGKMHPKRQDIRGGNGVLETVYFGSRKSDRFVRIYNKALEQGLTGERWVRFEMEYKGDLARRFDGNWQSVANTFMSDLLVDNKMSDGLWNSLVDIVALAVGRRALPYEKPPKSQEDAASMKWWKESVVAALRKTCKNDPERASEMIQMIMRAYRDEVGTK